LTKRSVLTQAAVGADFQIHFVDAPEEVLLERIRVRNVMASEGTFFIPESKLKEWVHIFEPPSSEELDSSKGLYSGLQQA
jgi:predicted kinase